MHRRPSRSTCAIAALAMLMAGCGGNGDGSDATQPESMAAGESAMEGDGSSAPAAGEASEGGDSGSATLTIGDAVWQFDGFVCAFGHEATSSDVYSFSSDARGQDPSGATVQFQVDVRDETGQGRYEGEDVAYEIHVTDVSDFEDPAVAWESSNAVLVGMPDGMTEVSIDGDSVTATGLFDDTLTDEVEAVEGSVEATCGAGSVR